jgi:ABC-type nitrate/sulfonate/bicarbonate transport system permease component
MLGYGLAVVIGITLGLAMGYYRLLYNLFEPLVEVLRRSPVRPICRSWCCSSASAMR